MPGPGGRHALRAPPKQPSSLDRFAACFRTQQSQSSIFDIPLTTLYSPYQRLPGFLTVSLDLLDACLEDGSIRADQLFASAGPDRVPEQALQELVNFLEEASEGAGGLTVQSLAYYGAPAASAFLMRFLEWMPEPLLTYQRYHQFLTAANMNPDAPPGKGANAAFKAMFPLAHHQQGRGDGRVDEHDQLLVMQALLVSLPGAHYALLQRMLMLIMHLLEADAAASPRRGVLAVASAGVAPLGGGAAGPLSPGGSSSSTSMSLQRLSLLFCATFLAPPPPALAALMGAGNGNITSSKALPASALDGSLRRAQEQQVLIYLVQHYDSLFLRQWVREAHAMPAAAPAADPNPHLEAAVQTWRRKTESLKLNFSRRHFDHRTATLVFRAWRQQSKSNRRKAEAYRQLALLKQELLAEKHKNGTVAKKTLQCASFHVS